MWNNLYLILYLTRALGFFHKQFFTILEVRSDDQKRYCLSLRWIFTSLLAYVLDYCTLARLVGNIPLDNYGKSWFANDTLNDKVRIIKNPFHGSWNNGRFSQLVLRLFLNLNLSYFYGRLYIIPGSFREDQWEYLSSNLRCFTDDVNSAKMTEDVRRRKRGKRASAVTKCLVSRTHVCGNHGFRHWRTVNCIVRAVHAEKKSKHRRCLLFSRGNMSR